MKKIPDKLLSKFLLCTSLVLVMVRVNTVSIYATDEQEPQNSPEIEEIIPEDSQKLLLLSDRFHRLSRRVSLHGYCPP